MVDDDFDAVRAAAELEAALGGEGLSIEQLEGDLVALRAQLAATEAARQAAEERADRAEAEISRARVRLLREAELELGRTRERVIGELLGVLDDLERALEAARAAGDDSALRQGIELVHRRFLAALAAQDVFPIPALGELFDARLHDAVSAIAAPGEPSGRIVAVVRTGYRIGDRLLRPAGVVVAAGG